ncbi:hypothetical protein O3M35_012072 [Rhynocoris fuscipes]|uniref:Receptor ligand binding region domain-containing protein n=1 Tax=Rhynocoris fuscipes TaxID=488301 RepID=A0AAW1CR27_9HEMI
MLAAMMLFVLISVTPSAVYPVETKLRHTRHQNKRSGGNSNNIQTQTQTYTRPLSLLEDSNQAIKPLWPVKREAVVEGDVVLGGLMMVHERSDTMTCGPVMPQGGIQAVETMLYTLDIINQRAKYFTIGAHILDDCDKDTYGLEMAVDFIKEKSTNARAARLRRDAVAQHTDQSKGYTSVYTTRVGYVYKKKTGYII